MKKMAFCLVLLIAFAGIKSSAFATDMSKPTIQPSMYAVGLKPIPNSYQIAKSTFLPDRFEDLGLANFSTFYDNHNVQNCENYPLSSCPTGGICERCPFDALVYRVYACSSPYLFTGKTCVCPTATPLTCTNDQCIKFCEDTCIEKTCTPSEDQTGCTNGTKACDNGCCSNTRKCCIPCEHKINTKPQNSSYTTSKCTDGEGTHDINTGWVCNSGYHERDNACEKDCIANNCSGYALSSCPTNGNCSKCTITATNCDTDGVKYKLDSCKSGYHLENGACKQDCTANSCSGYTLSSCPENGSCSSCTITATDCTTSGTKQKLDSCKTGYHVKNNACEKDCPANSCSGYTLSSCPENGNCSKCTITATNCNTDGEKYKLDSCQSGYTKKDNTCVAEITEGTITLIQKFPDGFADLAWGPWWNTAYKEPGQSVYNINFQRGESAPYYWKTTPVSPSVVKLGGELRFYAADVEVPSGTFEYCASSPEAKSYQDVTRELLYDIPTGQENYTITVTYCKKDCTINTCSGYSLTSCPTNGNCSKCSMTTSSCETSGIKYKLDSCQSGYHLKNSACEKDCAANSCTGYTLSSCPTNGNCSTCTITATSCSTSGTKYKLDSCKSGYKLVNGACQKDCTANSCTGYTLSSCPTNGNCSTCTITASDCSTSGTKYKLDSCQSGYHLKNGACEKDCTANSCTGYTLSSCPENGNCSTCTITASNCSTSGTKYKLDSCKSGYKLVNGACQKECTANSCTGYTLSSCPTNGNCSTCTITASDCSTSGTKYKLDSCQSGYHLKNGACEKDCSANSCTGYTLSSCPTNGNCSTCTITASDCSTSGTKYKLDSCDSGYELSGSSCVLQESCDYNAKCQGYLLTSCNTGYKATPCTACGITRYKCSKINTDGGITEPGDSSTTCEAGTIWNGYCCASICGSDTCPCVHD